MLIYLSVVVPIRNEEKHICETLNALVSQDYPKDRYELIVVDGRSTDKTREAVQLFIQTHPDANIRLMDNPGEWSSRARNIGARAAQGRLIAVIDGHVHIPNRQLFAAMERLKEEHGAMCLARPAPLLVPGLAGVPLWVALARRSWLAHSRNSLIYSDYEGFADPTSSGFAYDREVFDRVGYFDEAFDAAEDCEYHHRLKKSGIRAYTSPELTICSFPRRTLGGLFRQMVRYGVGRARLARKHPGTFTGETLIPTGVLLFFAWLPFAICLERLWPTGAIFYALMFTVYWSALFITGAVHAVSRRQLTAAVFVPLAIWITHMGLGWGFLRAILVRGTKTAVEPPTRILAASDGQRDRLPVVIK